MPWFGRAARLAALILALFPPVAACAEPVFPPGSRIGLEPPSGMAVSQRFSGFENPAKAAAITFVEMAETAFAELSGSLDEAQLQQQGLTLRSRETLTIGGREALLIAGEQVVGGLPLRKWMLVAADPTLTAMVIAQSVGGDEGYSDADMRQAFASLSLRPALSITDQLAALPFRIGNLSGFRPVRVVAGNSVYLTEGPKDQIQEAEQPVIVLAQSIGRTPPTAERPAFARQIFLAGAGLADLVVERSQSFRHSGTDWHEILARGREPSGQEVVVSQTIRFASDGYVRMVGISRAANREAFLPRFRAVVDSVDVE